MNPESKQHKILITDYTWESLDPEGRILAQAGAMMVVAETGEEDELVGLAPEVDGILTCWKPVTKKILQTATRCQVVGRYGVGLDNIDVTHSTSAGIVVTNVPDYCQEEVSDQAMALLLSCARKVTFYDRAIKAGNYDLQAGVPLYRIAGKTLGIVGFGKNGRTLYRKAKGFALNVITYDPYLTEKMLESYDVDLVDIEELLSRSDYVSVHVPLTEDTKHLFDYEAFSRMKSTAIVINTSRGGVIDSQGLLQALNEGKIAAAGLDVLDQEPPAPDDPLVSHAKTVVTPHAAFYSEESLLELQETAARQVAAVLTGEVPEYIVNREVLQQTNLRATFTNLG